MQGTTTLETRSFGFSFNERTIVRSVSLSVPNGGIVWLLGPAGSGKSSLLRLLAGETGEARIHTWGEAYYLGAPLGDRGRPALVGQRAKLMTGSVLDAIADGLAHRAQKTRLEQREVIGTMLESLGVPSLAARLDTTVVDLSAAERRVVSIARAFSGEARVVCLDEPTAGLAADEIALVLSVIARVAAARSALVVTHNQRDLAALGGAAVLLAGGVVQEEGSAEELIARPRTDAGRQFAETGSCSLPSPDAVEEELSEDAVRRLPRTGPGYLRWVLPGLAGMARPGIVRTLDEDLDGLVTEGVSVVIGLEEREMVPREALEARGISFDHEPIPDMHAPTLVAMGALCRRIDAYLSAGRRVAVHCRGGLGRTGTVLAAYLVRRGASAPEALSKVRLVEPRFVQSIVQIEFLRGLPTSPMMFVDRSRHDAESPQQGPPVSKEGP